MNTLLTRDAFREGVFTRDNHKCVVCGAPAVDAHHIIERRLFEDGGHYIDNGASVCGDCHMKCEQTLITCEHLREKIGITRPVLPPHFYEDTVYDKWGNIIMPDGSRLRGELFSDQSVQKALQPVLGEFSKYVKYSRTYHLPWSPGMHDDDRMMPDVDIFKGRKVVVMEKLDGENTSMYNDHVHARSVTSGGHPSRNWIRAFHGMIQANIPPMWRINVENMYAKHSIAYNNLDTYAYGFAIWDSTNHILDWKTTLEWFELLGIVPCPVVYWGEYDRTKIEAAYAQYKIAGNRSEHGGDNQIEGYVIRVDEPFHLSQFKHMVGKYVRTGHIQTTQHWLYGRAVVPNQLKPGLTGFETVT